MKQGSIDIEAMDFKHEVVNHEGVRLDGMRLLLAEDSETLQQIARELLEGVGATLVVVPNGLEAIARLKAEPVPPRFDAVLMDLQMPVMGGLEAAAAIRADARFGTLPIIAFTTCATAEERQRCLAVGMNDHVAKPITPRLLFETLGRFHRSDGAASVVARGPEEPLAATPLPVIAGVDTAEGLARLAGNQPLYLKLLRAFRDNQASAIDSIAAALIRGDFGTAERLTHTLKGVAGSLGAKVVQLAAGEFEKLIQERAPARDLHRAQNELTAALAPVLANLSSVLPAPPDLARAAVAGAADPAQTSAVVAQLKMMLEGFDSGAPEFIEQNAAVLQPAFAPPDWAQFTRQARGYAFADALALLQNAAGPPPG